MSTLNNLTRLDEKYSADYLRSLSKKEKEAWVWRMGAERMKFLQKDWVFWARDEQLPPDEWGKDGCYIWNIRCGRGWGKCLDSSTPIATEYGWTALEDIQLGESIFDENGNPCTVTFVSEIMYDHKCYDVVFSDGSILKADAEHQWVTHTKASRKSFGRSKTHTHIEEVRTTEEIKDTLYVKRTNGREVNHSINCCGALNCVSQELIIDPYVLGAWLGDGTSQDSSFACSDPQIIDEIKKAGYGVIKYNLKNLEKCPMYGIGKNEFFSKKLLAINVRGNKHIPKIYLRASYDQRLSLLQGLMDTDGSVETNGRCEFCGINKRLVEDVYELIVSLGLKAVFSEDLAKLNGKVISPRYRVRFTPYIPVFRLKRKLERLHTAGSQAERQKRRYIVEVRECESVPVRCIQVDSESHLFLAGKSMIPTHNTRTGAETFIWAIRYGGYKHPNLAGATSEEVRDVMVEGESGLLACAPEDFQPTFVPTLKKLVWPNGVTTHIYYGTEPDKARGPQSDFIWADEIAKWTYPEETFDNLLMGLRLGQDPRCIITSTPRPTKFLMDLERRKDPMGRPVCVTTKGSTQDNHANLSDVFLTTIIAKYEGTRLGKQELGGDFLSDNPDALWHMENIEKYRVSAHPELVQIVVGVDPAAKSEKSSDDTGIIVVGKGHDGHGYVLEDATIHGTPKEWATAAVAMYKKYRANWIVAETNQGGEMVEYTLRTIDNNISYKPVHAAKGKEIRAEPISSLYQQGKFHHIGYLRDLETELTEWIPNDGQKSPNRLDALTWAATALDIHPGMAPLPAGISKGSSFRQESYNDEFRGF